MLQDLLNEKLQEPVQIKTGVERIKGKKRNDDSEEDDDNSGDEDESEKEGDDSSGDEDESEKEETDDDDSKEVDEDGDIYYSSLSQASQLIREALTYGLKLYLNNGSCQAQDVYERINAHINQWNQLAGSSGSEEEACKNVWKVCELNSKARVMEHLPWITTGWLFALLNDDARHVLADYIEQKVLNDRFRREIDPARVRYTDANYKQLGEAVSKLYRRQQRRQRRKQARFIEKGNGQNDGDDEIEEKEGDDDEDERIRSRRRRIINEP